MSVEDHAAWNVGRYTVHGELASGGMATVHIGRMGGAGGFAKLVAVKRMHPQFAKDPDFLAMFLDEARLVTRIRHPNVVQPLDVIVEGGEVLLVMEYIHGEALSRIHRTLRARTERIPLRIAVAIMSGVLHGLHAAHEAKSERGDPLGIVHRDVSPQNVIVGVDGVARVLDFGIAKAADQVHLTREGELKGKLVYMAPEQLLGEPLTRRTDIFSASVVLWECLTGQRLFDNDSASALVARTRKQKVDPPSELAPEVSPQVDAIVLKGLMLQHAERWQTAREMAVALEEAVAPATSAQVGAWVEQVAAKALAERQSRIQEIESAGAENAMSSRELVADLSSDRIFTEDILSARSSSGLRPLPVGPPTSPAARSGSQRSSQIPQIPQPRDTATRRDRADPERLSGTPPPPSFVPTPEPPPPRRSLPGPSVRRDEFYIPPENDAPRPTTASASLEAPAIPTEYAAPAKTHVTPIRHRGRLGGVLVLLFVLAVAIGILGAPSLVRRSLLDGFSSRGLVASIDEVDLISQVGTARIVGVTVTAPDVPGLTVHAREVLADLNGSLEATSIVARDVEVNADVGYAPLMSSLSAWSNKHGHGNTFALPPSVQHVRVEAAHIVWNQPSGTNTKLEARSLTLDMFPKEGRRLGDDFQIEPTSVNFTTPLGGAGPWLLDATRSGPSYHVHMSLSQAHQQSYSFDLDGAADTATAALRVSRATPADLAMGPEAFGAAPTEVVKIDAVADLARKGSVWTGSSTVSIDGFHPAGAHPTTLGFDLAFAGAARSAVEVQRGRLSMGSGDAPLTGIVSILDDAIVVKLASTVLLKCDDGVVRIPLALSIDSRNVGGTSLLPVSRFCAAHR